MDSLLDLKTEVFRKCQEVERKKSQKIQEKSVSKSTDEVPHKSSKISLKDTITEDEESELKKSRKMLEAKAAFYERMTNKGLGSDGSKRYLVDFEQKVLSDPKKVEELKSQHSDEVLDEREQVFQPVHYQHLRENEARELGVGYFEFSLDEQTRLEQMNMLKSMHKETREKVKQKEITEVKRQTALQERLNKIRAKHNLPAEKPPEPPKIPSPEEEEKILAREQDRLRELSKQKVSQNKRAWDTKTLGEVYEEKIKKSRDEREPEFAPPSFYQNTNYGDDSPKLQIIPGTGELQSSTKSDPMKFLHEKKEEKLNSYIPEHMRDNSVLLSQPDYS